MSRPYDSLVAPAALGSVLGVGVLALSTKAVVLLVGLIAACILANVALAPLYLIIASIPMSIQLVGPITGARLLILAAVGLALYQTMAGRARWPSPFRKPEGLFVMTYLAASIMSVLVAGVSLVHVFSRVHEVIIFYIILAFVRDSRDVHRVFWVLAVIGVVQGLVVVGETRFGLVLPGDWHAMLAGASGEVIRAAGTTAHPIALGSYFIVALPCTVALMLWTPRLWIKVALMAALVLMAYAVFNTFSRSTAIGLAVLAFVAIAVTSRPGRYIATVSAIVGFVIFAAYGFSLARILADIEFLMPQALRDLIIERVGLMAASESFLQRFANWATNANMFIHNPLFGVGVGQDVGRSVEYLPSWGLQYFVKPQEAHNVFLLLASESGIFALSAFIGLWVWTFRCLARSLQHPDYRRYAKVFLIIASAQVIFFMFTPNLREIWLTLSIAAAMGHAVRRPAIARRAAPAVAPPANLVMSPR